MAEQTENPFFPPIDGLTGKIANSPRISSLKGEERTQIMFSRSSSLYSKTQELRKKRSVFGPQPNMTFGPKAVLSPVSMEPTDTCMMFDPSHQNLEWHSAPQKILIIKKPHDPEVLVTFKAISNWLIKEKDSKVVVERKVLDEDCLLFDEEFADKTLPKLSPLEGDDGKRAPVDLVVCLGGDGTLIHASSLFQEECPPIIAFHMGSLGFLAPFSTKTFREEINNVYNGNYGLTLRSRLKCQVRDSDDKIESEYLVLNEVVVDRGIGSSVTHVEIYCNGNFLTTVLGDGLIVSTPTGSTAYSMSAGASMVHPSVPGIVLTPICPHSLSFRPIVLPAGIELKIIISNESRNHSPVCSFDGRYPTTMTKEKYLRITTSIYPIPCISHQDHLSDWFNSLADCLHWNRRELKRVHSFKKTNKKFQKNGELPE